jgi:hypothetical protein
MGQKSGNPPFYVAGPSRSRVDESACSCYNLHGKGCIQMGVRFPLEPTRPDLSELQEIAPVTKGAPEQNAGPRLFSEPRPKEVSGAVPGGTVPRGAGLPVSSSDQTLPNQPQNQSPSGTGFQPVSYSDNTRTDQMSSNQPRSPLETTGNFLDILA